MTDFVVFPSIDDEFNFPPEVNQAIANSPEVEAKITARIAPKADVTALTAHASNTTNPHAVTKAQVGLGSVDNTSDTAKPVSNAQQTALNLKLDAAQKAAVNGVASLGSDGKVPTAQLPTVSAGLPPTVTGTYAARPAATTYVDGTVYYATDVLETYRSDGSTWVSVATGGNELGYTALDGSVPMFSSASTTYVDVTGLTMNITAGTRPITVRFDVHHAQTTAGTDGMYAIVVGGTVRREFTFRAQGADVWETRQGCVTVRGLTPGTTYIIKLQVKSNTGSSTSRTSGAPYIQAVNA